MNTHSINLSLGSNNIDRFACVTHRASGTFGRASGRSRAIARVPLQYLQMVNKALCITGRSGLYQDALQHGKKTKIILRHLNTNTSAERTETAAVDNSKRNTKSGKSRTRIYQNEVGF